MFVSIEGNIGSGKSTFLTRMKRELGDMAQVLLEPVSEWQDVEGVNLLEQFYKAPSKYAMAFQSYVALTMARRNESICESSLDGSLVLAERSIESGLKCFIPLQCKMGIIDCSAQKILHDLLSFLYEKSRQSDLIIYVRCQPTTSMARLKVRDREEETSITEDYIEQLHKLHEEWLMNKIWSGMPKVIVFENDEDRSEEDRSAYRELADALMRK